MLYPHFVRQYHLTQIKFFVSARNLGEMFPYTSRPNSALALITIITLLTITLVKDSALLGNDTMCLSMFRRKLLPPYFTLKKQAAVSSEKTTTRYETAGCRNPEHCNLTVKVQSGNNSCEYCYR